MHQGGGVAPGFLLLLHGRRQSAEPLRVEVGGVTFRPNDAGEAPDAVGGDDIWSTMIERYPGGASLIVWEGTTERVRADIELRPTDDVPVMELTLP